MDSGPGWGSGPPLGHIDLFQLFPYWKYLMNFGVTTDDVEQSSASSSEYGFQLNSTVMTDGLYQLRHCFFEAASGRSGRIIFVPVLLALLYFSQNGLDLPFQHRYQPFDNVSAGLVHRNSEACWPIAQSHEKFLWTL